ncbi:hypothetical protein [Caldisericum sp.]|uniref:hypothetical protein n=1 Tax=Caldisericum sp. TaxID=2499687 RepID=UPI003D0D083A
MSEYKRSMLGGLGFIRVFQPSTSSQVMVSLSDAIVESVMLRVSDPDVMIGVYDGENYNISFSVNDLYQNGFGIFVENHWFVQQYDTVNNIYVIFIKFKDPQRFKKLLITVTTSVLLNWSYWIMTLTEVVPTSPIQTPIQVTQQQPNTLQKQMQIQKITEKDQLAIPVNLSKKRLRDEIL